MSMFINIITVLILTTCSQVYANALQIEGSYDCKWIDADTGKTVKGEMVIRKNGNTFSMRSHYDDNTAYIGTGIYSQNKKNYAMVFSNPAKPEETGVTTVEIKDNTVSHTWLWAYLNTQSIEQTTCIKRNTKV